MGRWAVPGEQRTCEMGAQVTGEERDRKGPKYQISRHGLTLLLATQSTLRDPTALPMLPVYGITLRPPSGGVWPSPTGLRVPSRLGLCSHLWVPVLSAMPGAEQGSERPGE